MFEMRLNIHSPVPRTTRSWLFLSENQASSILTLFETFYQD